MPELIPELSSVLTEILKRLPDDFKLKGSPDVEADGLAATFVITPADPTVDPDYFWVDVEVWIDQVMSELGEPADLMVFDWDEENNTITLRLEAWPEEAPIPEDIVERLRALFEGGPGSGRFPMDPTKPTSRYYIGRGVASPSRRYAQAAAGKPVRREPFNPYKVDVKRRQRELARMKELRAGLATGKFKGTQAAAAKLELKTLRYKQAEQLAANKAKTAHIMYNTTKDPVWQEKAKFWDAQLARIRAKMPPTLKPAIKWRILPQKKP